MNVINVRVIPCLQISQGDLVKTVKFNKRQYIGDPINAIKIFNEKEVDELIVIDIDSRKRNYNIDFNFLEKLASESFIPMCYGGGINTFDEAKRIISMGFEKISLNYAFRNKPDLVKKLSNYFGAQSVVVSLDIKKNIFGKYRLFDYEKMSVTKLDPVEAAKQAEEMGAGEILLNSVSKDGTMSGYDLELIKLISEAVKIPVVALGGCSGLIDMRDAIKESKASAVAAGSQFVFYGELKSVLINYPERKTLDDLFSK
jgi:cyclase